MYIKTILTKWPIGRYSDKVSALYLDYSHVFSSTDLIKMGHIQKMKILKSDFFQLIIWYFMSGVKINNAQPTVTESADFGFIPLL